MANDRTMRPWILDTASASPVKTGKTWVMGFAFRGYSGGAGSLATIKDARGITICSLAGVAGGTTISENYAVKAIVINDLTLTAIDSGVLEVFVQ